MYSSGIFIYIFSRKIIGHGKKHNDFDIQLRHLEINNAPIKWVYSDGSPATVSGEMAVDQNLDRQVERVKRGELIGDIGNLFFRDPNDFRAGELHNNLSHWRELCAQFHSEKQAEVLTWL